MTNFFETDFVKKVKIKSGTMTKEIILFFFGFQNYVN